MLPLRHFTANSIKTSLKVASRYQSASATAGKDLVQVDVSSKGYAVVTLNRPPVNSLNLELLTSLSNTLDDMEKNKSRGVILTSSSNSVFSAGLDIMEMYKSDEKRMNEFWRTLQDVWIKLYGSFYPTAAAINGHSPAGGCLLALCCEYRVMLPKFTIGLNETQLGIVAPPWFMASMRNTVSNRVAEMALTEGTLFTTEEALKVGLIDEIAHDKPEALGKCEKFLDKFKKIPPQARGLSKQLFRNEEIKELQSRRDADIKAFVTAALHPKVQESLGIYIESLKKKQK